MVTSTAGSPRPTKEVMPMNWAREVCRTVRSAIEVEGRTARLVTLMVTATMCFVIVTAAS
jgi:hypothetical protein